jgi:hypothetical protein
VKYAKILAKAEMSSMRLRPDFLLAAEEPKRLLMVEVKQTAVEDAKPERRGVVEAMAYIHDAEDLLTAYPYPHALVVGWDASATPEIGEEIAVANQGNLSVAIHKILHSWSQ